MELRELKIIEKFFLSAQFHAIPLRETGVFLQQTLRKGCLCVFINKVLCV